MFSMAKDTIMETNQYPTEWENIFTNYASNRGLVSKECNYFKSLDMKQTDISNKMVNTH